MTPITTTITGALGIRAGLNRDSLTLQLSEIPDDALAVVIKGDNGMGKSTILNLALTPWREPPQIAGTIYDQFGETGLRELIWSHGDETYRTRIEYRQTSKTKTQRAYLHVLAKRQQHGDGYDWKPVTLPDNTASDGKASTYDACLSHILGDAGIYYLSAFRAQNAPKLAEHSDPKGLMRVLLNMDEPARLSVLAFDVAREIKRHHEGLRAQVANLDGHPARLTALDQAIKDIRYSHPARAEANIAAIDGVSRAKAELDRAMAGDLDRQRLIDARAAVQRRLDKATGSTADAIQQAQRAYTAAKQRVTDAQRHASATLATLQRDLTAAQARVTAAQATLSQRGAIAQAQADADALAAQIAAQEQTAAALADQLSALRDLAGQVRTLEAQQTAAAQAGKASAGKVIDLQARIADLNARAGFVALVPCKGEGQYAACPALQDAIAARALADQTADALPAATAETESKRSEWKAIAAQIADLSAKTVNLRQCAEAHSAAVTLVGDLRNRLDAVRAVAARGAALELAEQHLAEATAAAADIDARIGAHRDETSRHLGELDNETAAAIDAVTAAEMLAANTIAALRAELAALPEPGTDQAITQARAALAAALAASEESKAAMQQAAANIAQHQAEQAALRAALEQGAAVIAQRDHLAAEIADWTLLAMGLRGVIDLSIEDAGPSIAATANRLLTDAYGPRFSVRIVTQRDQANGRTVETFDISVIDADSGMESSILQKSGGEAVWLDKALTDAVGLYHQDAAGVRYETLFADEADDGLTQERKAQFYRMDRSALEIGGYQRKYFISHNPDAWAYADHVIDLAKYRAQ